MRKKIKKPITKRGEELLLMRLDKLDHSEFIQVAILNQSIMNSWQGVFPLKDSKTSLREERLNEYNKIKGGVKK